MITRPLWTLPGKSVRLWIAEDVTADLADRETVRQAWKRLFEGLEIPTPTADWNSGDVYYRLLPTGHVLVESLWGNSEIRLIRQAEHARLFCKHDWKIIGATILGVQTPGSLRATDPGNADPALQSSESHIPGVQPSGSQSSGLQSPFSQSPAQPPLRSLLFGSQFSVTPRSRISEFQIPEQQIPGSHIPEQSISGLRIPESQIPRSQILRSQIPGSQIPGSQIPGSQNPGSQRAAGPASGSRTSGSRTPGSKTPGSKTPGSKTPGSQRATGPTPGSRTPGSWTPGSWTPESYTLGSVTIGPLTSESETPDSQVIDVLYVCEACSSWTYHQMKFVGYQRESLEHRLGDVIDEPVGNSRR